MCSLQSSARLLEQGDPWRTEGDHRLEERPRSCLRGAVDAMIHLAVYYVYVQALGLC